MRAIAYLMIVIGYGLLYVGLMDFSGNNQGIFQAFGLTTAKKPFWDVAEFQYTSPVANMTSQPAVYSVGTGLTGSVSV